MLAAVGVGIAMGNAVEVTRAAAKHRISKTNDDDGVAFAVDKYIVSERKAADHDDEHEHDSS